MAHDEDDNSLTLDDLWHVGYAVGVLLRPQKDVYDGLAELDEWERNSLLSGYAAGVRETEETLALRLAQPGPDPVPTGDEIPY